MVNDRTGWGGGRIVGTVHWGEGGMGRGTAGMDEKEVFGEREVENFLDS